MPLIRAIDNSMQKYAKPHEFHTCDMVEHLSESITRRHSEIVPLRIRVTEVVFVRF